MSGPVDRLAEGYEPRFDIDYAAGKQGEMFVSHMIAALQSERVEIKTDERARSTGNIYVEYECMKRRHWAPSGIATTDALLWVFVLDCGNLAVAISTERLKELGREAFRMGRTAECKRGSHPTRGVKIRLRDLVSAGTRAGRGSAMGLLDEEAP